MDLSFPIPVIGKAALSTQSSLMCSHNEWQNIVKMQTADFLVQALANRIHDISSF
jgi:hypothetical protein